MTWRERDQFKSARKILPTRITTYLAHVVDTNASKPKLEGISVVHLIKFTTSRPLDREIEFSIGLIPGTTPNSQTPYRIELKELKEFSWIKAIFDLVCRRGAHQYCL